MAPVATNPAPSRTARIVRHVLAGCRHVAIAVGIESALAVLHLPIQAHLTLAVALHLAAELIARHR